MAQTLAPIYLDNDRVRLQGDPRPTVSKILNAGGKKPDEFRVVRLKDKNEEAGETLAPQDVIDRTSAGQDVYLKCITKGGPKGTAKGAGSNAGMEGQWPSSGQGESRAGQGGQPGDVGERDFGSGSKGGS